MLEYALHYARLGWRIFRLTGYKTPLRGTHGHLDATGDVAQIEIWWSETPWANIGLATGDIIVIDADGPGGLAKLRSLAAKHGGLPTTRVAQTARGLHFYYRCPPGVRIKGNNDRRAKQGDDGIDIKADGGYVMLPPSVNKKNGFVYKWANNAPITELPAWLVEYAQERSGARPTISKQTMNAPGSPLGLGAPPPWVRQGAGRAERALANMIKAELPEFLSALKLIPADCSYDDWFKCGASIHNFDSGLNGLAIFKAWSRSSSNAKHTADVDSGVCEKKWAEYEKPKPGRLLITKAWIYAESKKYKTDHCDDGDPSQNYSDQAEGSRASSNQAHETKSSSDDALIDELASLSFIAYAKRRKEAAKQLGIGVTALDKAVERRRAELEGEASAEPSFLHWTVEPWPEPVDGDALIVALVHRIQSHIVMPSAAALTVALWIMFAWIHDEAAIHSPILMITSPEPDCGKTTLLGLVSFLVPCSLPSVGISPAALYRAIEKWQPTLMIDEADVAFVDNEDLRSVVNSGWTRGQGVVRCDGDDNEPRLFSTFCPKAIGLKGKKLPDTTASRAIVVELKRKLAHESVADFRHVDNPELHELRQQLLRWATDNAEALEEASPTLPPGFANRLAANWHLLLAIAEAAGGEWPEKAREAASTIAKLKATLGASIGIQLLSDIRDAFGSGTDRLFSLTLIDKLTADPEGAWAGYNWGKPFTQKQLASRLRDYGILSETIWIDNRSAKGYKRAAFEDVWTRYLQA